jgi:hypothetical protein
MCRSMKWPIHAQYFLPLILTANAISSHLPTNHRHCQLAKLMVIYDDSDRNIDFFEEIIIQAVKFAMSQYDEKEVSYRICWIKDGKLEDMKNTSDTECLNEGEKV